MDFNKENKSFEELLREKVAGHEFPFEGSSWAQMQNKLQAHQAQAAAQQTSIYKSMLAKAGKIAMTVVSGSAIVYTTLSLTGVIDGLKQNETADAKTQIQAEQQMPEQNNLPDNSVSLKLDDVEVHNIEDTHLKHEANGNSPLQLEHKSAYNNQENTNGYSAKNPYMGSRKNASGNENSFVNSAKQKLNNSFGNNNKQNSDQNSNSFSSKNNVLNNAGADKKLVIESNDKTVKEEQQNNNNIGSKQNAENKEVVENEITPKAADNKIDSAENIANNLGNKYPERPNADKPKHKISIGVLAGGSIMYKLLSKDAFVPQNPAITQSTKTIAVTPVVGVFAAMPVSQKIAAETGLQYTNYNLFDVVHNSYNVNYEIYRDSTVTNTQINSVKFLEMPLMAKYSILPRFSVGTGLKLGMLLGANADQYKTHYYNTRSIGITNYQESDPTSIQGMRNVRFNALSSVYVWVPVQLNFAVSNRFTANATYNFGLTDLTKNSIFGNSRRDNLSNAQLTVGYRIF